MMKKTIGSLGLTSVCVALCLCLTTFAAETGKVSQPFNGKNLDGWKTATLRPKNQNFWTVAKDVKMSVENPRILELVAGDIEKAGVLVNMAPENWSGPDGVKGVDFFTEKEYGDCTIEIEFMVPTRSNSGIYPMGLYEIQVLDSWGKPEDKLSQGDVGAIYSAGAPKLNASLEPGQWQKFVIEFEAPRFDSDGNKTKNARFPKVTLNGKVVQEDVEAQGPTGGGISTKESPKGPLMLQGNHGPVAFRNIKITEK